MEGTARQGKEVSTNADHTVKITQEEDANADDGDDNTKGEGIKADDTGDTTQEDGKAEGQSITHGNTAPGGNNSTNERKGKTKGKPITPENTAPEIHNCMNDDKGTLCLAFALRLFLFSPIKWKRGVCWMSFLHLVLFSVYITKISYVTSLTLQIGNCRLRVISTIDDGYIALHHTLLQKWDASFETVPYPPSQGKFAVYNTDDLRNRINFAVEKLYNAEFEATGYFRKLPEDEVSIHVVYFILIDNPVDHTLKDVHTNVKRSFKPDLGLSAHRNAEGNTIYSYNVTTDLNNNNLSYVLNRVLEVKISFSLHSLRVNKHNNDARCLQISGNVLFSDEDHSGQVKVDLSTKTLPIKCTSMNNSLIDSPQCRHSSENVALNAKRLVISTIIVDGIMFIGGIISLFITYLYMRSNFQSVYGETSGKKTLPACEYFGNFQWWLIPSIVGDAFTLVGVIWIEKLADNHDLENQPLNQWDKQVVYIGSGCLLTWFSLLRFIKINHKFTLLFKTLKRSAIDVIFFLSCVTIIFVGFWLCTYVVLGPYHIKFQEQTTTAETLFAMLNGDEIFATFALLQEKYAGDVNTVWIFSRIIIYGYVTIFTVLVFNLLIALFNNAYEVVKNSYEQQKEARMDSIPITLSYFMLLKYKTCTIVCCRKRDFTCRLLSIFIHFLRCTTKICTICCCQCEIREDNSSDEINAKLNQPVNE